MSGSIQSPGRGQPMRAQWGADVADMLSRHESVLAAGSADEWRNLRGGTGAIRPFAVKWSAADSSLVVYLPDGSCNLLATTVLNVAATGGGGWYKVHWGAQKLSAAGEVSVYAHVKARFRIGSGSIHPVVFVDAESSTADNNEYARAGDVWSMEIAKCTVTADTTGSDPVYTRAVRQLWSGPVDWLAETVPGLLELHWCLSTALASATDSAAFTPTFANPPGDSAPVTNGAWDLGGASSYVVALPCSASESKAYYVVDMTGSAPVSSVTATAPSANLDQKLVYHVYTLQHGRVVADRRAILAERAFYP